MYQFDRQIQRPHYIGSYNYIPHINETVWDSWDSYSQGTRFWKWTEIPPHPSVNKLSFFLILLTTVVTDFNYPYINST